MPFYTTTVSRQKQEFGLFFTGVIPISEFFYNKHDVATKYFTFIAVLSK